MTKHLLIAALVAFALSGCGQQSDSKSGATPPPAADKKPAEPPKK